MTTRLASLADAAEPALSCRDEGHVWTFVTDTLVEHRGKVVEFTQERQCRRCTTVRRRTIAVPSMAIRRVTYGYPDDYLMAPRSGVTARDVRVEVLARVVADRGQYTAVRVQREES